MCQQNIAVILKILEEGEAPTSNISLLKAPRLLELSHLRLPFYLKLIRIFYIGFLDKRPKYLWLNFVKLTVKLCTPLPAPFFSNDRDFARKPIDLVTVRGLKD